MDWSVKGLWLPGEPVPDEKLIGARLFDGPFSWPVMVARQSAIEANIATMAGYCRRHGVQFAPHGKTTMAPKLFAAQLAAGAWGITVATPHQALVARRCGVPRVLLANVVLDPRVLRWAAEEVAAYWEFVCYVDSLAGVAVLREALSDMDFGRVDVLVEMGYAGGRTGCRSVAEAVQVAEAAAAVPGVRVVGVSGFEGLLPDAGAVSAYLGGLVEALRAIPVSGPGLISAGGSTYFDTVIDVLGAAARANGWTVVLRSGAVVTHDDGVYARTTPFGRAPDEGSLVAALEVWAQVLSVPEPDLAIVGAGRRDVPFDVDLPVPLQARSRSGQVRPLAAAVVDRLNDQHAYLRGAAVEPGELVRFGISHPCTAFDKWRIIPVVDDGYRVVDLLHTYF